MILVIGLFLKVDFRHEFKIGLSVFIDFRGASRPGRFFFKEHLDHRFDVFANANKILNLSRTDQSGYGVGFEQIAGVVDENIHAAQFPGQWHPGVFEQKGFLELPNQFIGSGQVRVDRFEGDAEK